MAPKATPALAASPARLVLMAYKVKPDLPAPTAPTARQVHRGHPERLRP